MSVRDPAKATALAERGVRVRRGDYDDAASLAHAFEGAAQLLLVSAAATGEAALRQHADRDRRGPRGGRAPHRLHQPHGREPRVGVRADARPRRHRGAAGASGLAFTALRNGFYASSGRMLLGQAFETGELAAPADGPVSWTAHDDLAEAAAIVLTDEGRFEGPTPPLTGSAALDLAGLAARGHSAGRSDARS